MGDKPDGSIVSGGKGMNLHNWQFAEMEATRRQEELLAEVKRLQLAKLAQKATPSLLHRLFLWLKPRPKVVRRTRLHNSRPAFR